MKVNDIHYLTIRMEGSSVFMVEQNKLPFEFSIFEAKTYKDTCIAISTMITRGAGAIGAAGGFAMAQAFLENDPFGFAQGSHGVGEVPRAESGVPRAESRGSFLQQARDDIRSTRPTAQNLFYAIDRVYEAGVKNGTNAAVEEAQKIAAENVEEGRTIGTYGRELIKDGMKVMTHCNAGWLGFVDYGTAVSVIHLAHEQGKKFFVWADETRPRSQGARLTAWELVNAGIDHAIVPDNAGAWLMEKGDVDMIIVGADRIAANGDTANKIGTFEKAIVAKRFNIPFYVAAPFSTFDMSIPDGSHIPIEQRSEDEVHYQTGPDSKGLMHTIRVSAPGSKAINPAFDVTPAELITGIITDKGIVKPETNAIAALFNRK
ncbi:MAG: S-methyl-5-thioribose-1-phosphate isomerase [Marinilabiliales bacterium]|nr:MAG: S-methyl-5-thioribose-1-phosphate isomerase [Marinilabiliales bacterium]